MRSRSNSGVRLDHYMRLAQKTILSYQDEVTGLLPSTSEAGSAYQDHAWVRDNVYSILCVWGLALAYQKNSDWDEDRVKAYELKQCVVKLMRGLLMCMMRQANKLEKFKMTQSPADCFHAKYNSRNCDVVCGDYDWGHVQIDATSLYLLCLAQMTASGLHIVYTLDEVAFIQNMVFYIDSAYRIQDYGIWERGDKTNHGLPELNASSIGMAKAALMSIHELDLFGAQGGPASVIHVLPDEAQHCSAILHSMLPRESASKEVDASLLSIIGYPAFAIQDTELIDVTRKTIIEKLRGRYGCKRFLRDGFKTAREDPNRLYYEPWELAVFENIECEWPLFFCYLILEGIFNKNTDQVNEYFEALNAVLIKREGGLMYVPQLYAVPPEKVDAELQEPHSQEREAQGRLPFRWGQSLYILACLLKEGFLQPGELDPLNRRLVTEKRPDLVVQVVILAEDEEIREKLAVHDVQVQTLEETMPVTVQPARVLSGMYARLGNNRKLKLSGRPSQEVGLLSTSKLYRLKDRIFAFTPSFTDFMSSYTAIDVDLLNDKFRMFIAILRGSWHGQVGRPTFVAVVSRDIIDTSKAIPQCIINTLKKLKSGYINGTRVQLGDVKGFISTSCITELNFLGSQEDGDIEACDSEVMQYIDQLLQPTSGLGMRKYLERRPKGKQRVSTHRKASVRGIIRRTKSIHVSEADSEVEQVEETERQITPVGSRHEWDLTMQSQYTGIECEELVEILKHSDNLSEQGDIVHYLYMTKGADWNTGIDNDERCTVQDLLVELYEKACYAKQWWLVRHTAGMLKKRVEDLAKAVNDLLVRQKQVTVGMPPEPRERTITRPLPPEELRQIISEVYGPDSSTAMLTQEILVYLAMFIRTEPNLFHEMLRLRVGLIIQVMASELARSLSCSGEEGAEHLLELSPYELKTLLHHILSGKEFGQPGGSGDPHSPLNSLSKRGKDQNVMTQAFQQASSNRSTFVKSTELESTLSVDRQGQWLRRRKLDGALNRVPVNFYPKLWKVLEKCHGLYMKGSVLPQSLTKEMTPGEMKFALQVETQLNRIPEPEYRQLMVEALMVLILVTEMDPSLHLGGLIHIEDIISQANKLFIDDQVKVKGDSLLCCASTSTTVAVKPVMSAAGDPGATLSELKCGGKVGICQIFYDSAPSGRFGTMTYLCKSVAQQLNFLPQSGELQCITS